MGVYLVTGAAGFIGYQVCTLLLRENHSVVGIDNVNDAYDIRLKQWRLAQLEPHRDFAFHRVDICDRPALTHLFESLASSRRPPDAVINLAARAGVRYSLENPWVYFETNVTGMLNILDLCRAFGIAKFVQASTSSVYGNSNPVPYSEDALTDRPISPYAASKKGAEELCYSYHHLHQIDVTVLRFFTVYGPAGRPDMSPFRFVQWACEGRPVTIYGDGRQSRDFTFVSDIARGAIAALRPVGFEVINLGSDRPIVLMDALRVIEQQLGVMADVRYLPRHPADVDATWADISKARDMLGWEPRCSFESGVAELIAWYRQNRAWAREISTD